MSTTRLGKCINFGNCAKADRREIIELDVTEDFVCPECNSDLLDDDTKGKKGGGGGSKKGLIIGIVAVLLLGGGAAAYFLLGDKEEKTPEPRMERTIETPVDEAVTDEVEPQDEPEQIAEPEPEPAKVEEPKPVQQPKPATPSSGTVSVSGGTYTGELKNGKPHGMGTLKYNTHTLISKRDSKNRYAEAGEYITGEFYEGELVSGKLFDKNGDQREALNIGRPR